jgi:SAM-dependent methyltransferase
MTRRPFYTALAEKSPVVCNEESGLPTDNRIAKNHRDKQRRPANVTCLKCETDMSNDWEERYRTGDMPWEKGEASPGLVDFLSAHPDLERGSVCVPGCGTGHDVRAWASAGFEAYGFDLAPSAIRLCKERSAGLGNVHYALANFLEDKPPRQFDWLFEHTLFCAIDLARRDDYVQAVLRWLKPDGRFLAVHYFIPDKDGPPFGTTREEVAERFSPYFRLKEDWVPRSYPNRVGLERMFWWERIR